MTRVRRGFTLVEMTIVLFIISLLILIILPNLNGQRSRAQKIHRDAMVTMVQGQATAYLDENPTAKTVTIEELGKQGYLTAQQVERAGKEGLVIHDGQVERPAKK
ncbi:competence type IV pilus major pilin ComGC [Levilactobacillus suantsaii]|uniref:Prepilin-type N-terminal cleavage/methylation domain-containing protein n=1 Tax=Levilactobacillus suantsaii TaxID=2292255 RepID=A0A4Q0VLY1_9LACO|nr:competence type IV pilus major pilin ComGC [Levilactobacillus suantsaii]QMU07874.1 prepilin-type N-terminal cleavage/methylation domain-containing protein [Levilactobacillus suantsaii]RXI79755.1 prepilin-type N-terminal cleavage/methylation domain-containing protein [Levilactobacillus suantsaii]